MADEEDKKPAIEEQAGETTSAPTTMESGQLDDDLPSVESMNTASDEAVSLSEDSGSPTESTETPSEESVSTPEDSVPPDADVKSDTKDESAAEPEQSSLLEQAEKIKQDVQKATDDAQKSELKIADSGLPHASQLLSDTDMLEYLEYLWMIWADFSISIISPLIDPISPPIVIAPLLNEDGKKERVFCINDEGFRLTTSRGEEAYSLGQSMFKYFNTIEKMIKLLVERLKTGGIDKETEVRVAFFGFELGQRKAFESILNLEENVVVTNYDPGEWGDRYMKNILELAERGYGLPPSSPRTKF